MPLRACVFRAGISFALALSACDSAGETWDQSNLDVMTMHDGFARIDPTPFVSTVGPPFADVIVWVDPVGAPAYRTIDPDVSGSGAHVPRGTQIVRAVLDGNGAVAKLTMMCKGAPGYDASLGDWWFAETDPAGVPLTGDDGAPIMGAVSACHTCHIERAGDDFLFGVAAADR